MRDPVSAVLFDLDNTLVDRDLAFLAWACWFAGERLSLVDDAAAGIVARLVELDAGGYGPRPAMFQSVKEQFPDLSGAVEEFVAAFTAELRMHLPPIDPTAEQLLEALRDAGTPWGIVTNGSPTQLLKIEKVGLDARAACVVVSEIVGLRKPDPLIFRMAAERLGVTPSEVLFVGDHPDLDIAGAAGVGMRTAWMRRGREWPDRLALQSPDYLIDSLAELISVVEN
jgi:HAD superfamily hydrolase (TIGR01509 family)